jgi:DNA-binding beta-propeller fold protein YncE
MMLWEDSGVTATVSADGKNATATITRFGRCAIMSPLASEIPPPAAPKLSLVSASKTAVLLSWQNPGYGALDGYNLYCAAGGGDYAKVNTDPIALTEYRHSPVEPGVYSYRLTLVNTGALEGEPGPALQVEITGTDFYTVFGNYGSPDKPLQEIRDLAILPLTHELIAVDAGLSRLAVYSPMGVYRRYVGSKGKEQMQFESPTGVGVNPDGKLVYIADTGNDRIVILDNALEYVRKFGGRGTSEGFLTSPSDVAVRSDGVVFVTDTGNNRIEYYTPHGTYLGQFGNTGQASELLSAPTFIVMTATDSIYVTDAGSERIVEFTSKLAYEGAIAFSDMGTVPPLEAPGGLALDSEGRVYIADSGRNRILVVNASGKYEYLFGSYGHDWGEFGDESPIGISFDSITGFLFAADSAGGRIQMFQP